MATTSAEPRRPSSTLLDRWPTALALVQVALALFVIVGDGETDLASGVAAMACIYMAAYVVGNPVAAWPAYPAVIVVLVGAGVAGLDARIVMTVLLFALWLVAVVRGRSREGRWFAIETAGLVVFGGLTLLALPFDERAAGVIAGIGFLSHGLWDAYHFAKNKIVNRPWSEMCVVMDLIIGPAIVVVALTG